MEKDMKSKIVFRCTDKLWNELRLAHKKKYVEDKDAMNLALIRAVEEFIK